MPKSDSVAALKKYEKVLDNVLELKSGMVLLMNDKKYILVGDVNRNLGICDDCTVYGLKDIRKYAMLPGFEDNECNCNS